jgi:ribonuclease R
MKVTYEDTEYEKFVGTIGVNQGVVHPLHTTEEYPFKLLIQQSQLNGARPGDTVEVSAIKWTQKKKNLRTRVVQVFGKEGDESTEQQMILNKYSIRNKWPDKVIQQSESIKTEIDQDEIAKRFDFRDRTTITIDPDTAKDFDDAISLKKLNDNEWELGIHIADVVHYMPSDTPMDKEAMKRGNSTYLVGRVVPMLPEKLSNGVCSLRPNEEKLTFSTVFHINTKGEITNEYIYRSVIESDKRFTYVEAQQHINGEVQDEWTDMILTLNKISTALRKQRANSGGITFESVIRNIILDEKGHPIDIVTEEASEAHALIEDLMLLANRKVAKFIWDQKRPSIYRTHDRPDEQSLGELKKFLKLFGMKADFSNPEKTCESLNKIMKRVDGEPYANVIKQRIIRSMSKARYDAQQGEHFGLGFNFYTHFTSPIRRYSDVVVHRVLAAILSGQKSIQNKKAENIARHVSSTEIESMQAERESRKLKEAQFMEQFINEVFEGVIVGVENFGVFIELKKYGVRGLIHKNDLMMQGVDINPYKFQLNNGRKKYKLGDVVSVYVSEVDIEQRYVNFYWNE